MKSIHDFKNQKEKKKRKIGQINGDRGICALFVELELECIPDQDNVMVVRLNIFL